MSSSRVMRRGDEDRMDEDYRRKETVTRRAPLNEYFIKGEGINRQVLQAEICKWLGAEATSRPGSYNGEDGYLIKAMRPFTPDMLEDLRRASREYTTESRHNRENYGRETSYAESRARERLDRDVPYMESGRQDPRAPPRIDRDDRSDPRYGSRMDVDGPSALGYSSSTGHHQDPRSGYSVDSRGPYPPTSYSPSPAYSAAPSSGYPSITRYPPEPSYPGYSSSMAYSSSAVPTSVPAYSSNLDARYGADPSRYQYETPSSRDPGYVGYPSGYPEPPRAARDLPPQGYSNYPTGPESSSRRPVNDREYQEYLLASSGSSRAYESARSPYDYEAPSGYGGSRGTPSDAYSSSRRR